MFRASRDFIVLSLDVSRVVEDHLAEHQPATALSMLDHNVAHPNSPHFHDITSLHFTQHYTMPKKLGSNPTPRKKAVMVIVHPYCHPDSNSLCMWDMFFVVMKDDPAFKEIFYLLMLIQLLHYCICNYIVIACNCICNCNCNCN